MTLPRTTSHFLNHVLLDAAEYLAAEQNLSIAEESGLETELSVAKNRALRKAASIAISIDGLIDRASLELSLSKTEVRRQITRLCTWPSGDVREGALDRVRAVANAYKHAELTDATLPITSDSEILTVALGYGLDGYGVGKMGGLEVIVQPATGAGRKFLGDVPTVLRGWAAYIIQNHGILPDPLIVGCLQIYP